MPKITLTEPKDFYHHYPRVVVVVTTRAGGFDNAMAAAWHSPISREPLLYGVAISPKRYSYELILQSKEFGLNFLAFDHIQLITDVGSTKGKEMDKFSAFHIVREKPIKTSVPILKDAYAAYECRLVDHQTLGDHEWMVGEIVAVHLEKSAFDEEERLNLARVKPALYISRDSYLTANPDTIKVVERKSG